MFIFHKEKMSILKRLFSLKKYIFSALVFWEYYVKYTSIVHFII